MTTWTLGSVTVTRIEEQLGVTNQPCEKYFPNFEREVLQRHLDWAAPDHYSPQHDRFVTSVHSWLVRSGDLTILIDTCGGNHKNRPWTHASINSIRHICSVCAPPALSQKISTWCFAPICMPTTSDGIRRCATGAGYPPSPTQNICSRGSMTPIGTSVKIQR